MPDKFILHSDYAPTGDQPEAIDKLVHGIESGMKEQVLLGVTGSGKTFTMANVIAQANRPTLVLAHNKTLAAQLCSEFGLDEYYVDVLPASAGRLYDRLVDGPAEQTPAVMASNGHILGTALALSSCRDLKIRTLIALLVQAVDSDDLAHHFSRSHVAHTAFQRGRAEGAAHAAAHLRRNAQGIAVMIAHQHALYDVAVGQREKIFFRAVLFGAQGFDDLDADGGFRLAQLLLKRRGEIAHFREIRALLQPAVDLFGAEGLFAELRKVFDQLLLRIPQQAILHLHDLLLFFIP